MRTSQLNWKCYFARIYFVVCSSCVLVCRANRSPHIDGGGGCCVIFVENVWRWWIRLSVWLAHYRSNGIRIDWLFSYRNETIPLKQWLINRHVSWFCFCFFFFVSFLCYSSCRRLTVGRLPWARCGLVVVVVATIILISPLRYNAKIHSFWLVSCGRLGGLHFYRTIDRSFDRSLVGMCNIVVAEIANWQWAATYRNV